MFISILCKNNDLYFAVIYKDIGFVHLLDYMQFVVLYYTFIVKIKILALNQLAYHFTICFSIFCRKAKQNKSEQFKELATKLKFQLEHESYGRKVAERLSSLVFYKKA